MTSEVWVFKKRNIKGLEATQMRFLQPLLCVVRLDRQ
jgi:hypothetical protein